MQSRTVDEKMRLAILNNESIRYHLLYSSAFDTHPFIYHTVAYKAAVKRGGGKNIREAKEFGWSNMPKVVTWTGNREINKAIESELYQLPPFNAGRGGLPSPIIRPVDW